MFEQLCRSLVALVVVIACAVAPLTAAAQSEPSSDAQPATTDQAAYDEYFMSDEHRQRIYEESKKKPTKAVLLTLAFPGLGNIYAEQYLLAGVAIVFMVFAGTFVGYGLSTRQGGIVVLGAVTAGIAYGGGAATSLLGVNEYNRKLREGLKVGGEEVARRWGPTFTLTF